MGLVFVLKGAPQVAEELVRRLPNCLLKEENLWRRTRLLIELPHVTRQAEAPGLLFLGMIPRAGIHHRHRDTRSKDLDSGPVGKWQRANLQHRFLSAPDHRAI